MMMMMIFMMSNIDEFKFHEVRLRIFFNTRDRDDCTGEVILFFRFKGVSIRGRASIRWRAFIKKNSASSSRRLKQTLASSRGC